MGNGHPFVRMTGVSNSDDAQARLRELEADVAHQKQIIAEIEREGHTALGAKTLLRLLEEERSALAQQLGPKP